MVERQGDKERGKPASPERQRVEVWSLFAHWGPYVGAAQIDCGSNGVDRF